MRQPKSPFSSRVETTDTQIGAVLRHAAQSLQLGHLEDAERKAKIVLADRHNHPGALSILGHIAMINSRYDEAIDYFEQVRSIQSRDAVTRFSLGEAYRLRGNLDLALRHFRQAVKLNPTFAEAYAHAGEVLRAMDRPSEAADAYQKAIAEKSNLPQSLQGLGLLLAKKGELEQAIVLFEAAMDATPAHQLAERATIWANLGVARTEAGHTLLGVEALCEAINCTPNDGRYWRQMALTLNNIQGVPTSESFRRILIALFRRDDIDPHLLATAAVAAIRHSAEFEAFVSDHARSPRPNATESGALLHPLFFDELFLALLSATPVRDSLFETMLTRLRRDFILMPRDYMEQTDKTIPEVFCALARQCFLNEYVYWVEPDEEVAVESLIQNLKIASLIDHKNWTDVAVLACYVPLCETQIAHIDTTSAPESIRSLFHLQVQNVIEERDIQKTIPELRPIANSVSLAVQHQYEENPYPRWTRGQLGLPRPMAETVLLNLPHISKNETPTTEHPRILIAGCGTGLQTMKAIQTYANASIMAVDLSRASLAYGIRKLSEYGIGGVRHLQADILDLTLLDERFDLIECFGVLHHMQDPLRGLKTLTSLLDGNGLMFLGLYSQIARGSVLAGRKLIAELALTETPMGIRTARRAIMSDDVGPEFRPLLSPASDFWTLSECRDLIFHIEEHRFTLLEIDAMLDACNLQFLGLELPISSDRRRFAAENPDPQEVRSLEAWHRFEIRNPDVFGDTYRIWAKRC